jgi:hypothetical protein
MNDQNETENGNLLTTLADLLDTDRTKARTLVTAYLFESFVELLIQKHVVTKDEVLWLAEDERDDMVRREQSQIDEILQKEPESTTDDDRQVAERWMKAINEEFDAFTKTIGEMP